MKTSPVPSIQSDPAAIFSIAQSLWLEVEDQSASAREKISDTFSGMDGFLREAMGIAQRFEEWACENIAFDHVTEVWPYLLLDRFGEEYLRIFELDQMPKLNEPAFLRIAHGLRLPIFVNNNPRVSVQITIQNPIKESFYEAFQIQTVRVQLNRNNVEWMSPDADPYDVAYGDPFVGLYGVFDREAEHIADRCDFDAAFGMLKKLAPGVTIPDPLVSTNT